MTSSRLTLVLVECLNSPSHLVRAAATSALGALVKRVPEVVEEAPEELRRLWAKGMTIRKVIEKGITPRVNTGIAHKEAGVGQVRAGLVRPPMEMFEEALVAYAEKYGFLER